MAELSTSSLPGVAAELTAAEQLIWTGQRLDPASPLYNMALAVEIAGAVDPERLRRAFQILVDDDPVLRTVFRERDGRPRREVLERVEARVEVLELPEGAAGDGEAARVLAERTARPLPTHAPLFDVCLIRRGPDRSVLYFNQHHIATDAWSAGVLYRRWGTLYERIGRGEERPSLEVPSFSDYVEGERALRTSPAMARSLDFWKASAAGFSPALPIYGHAAPGSGRTERVRVPLGPERTAALRRRAAEAPFRALTPDQSHYLVFATLLLAWLHRVSDTGPVSIGAPWHNRRSALQRETLGLFIELYPLRVTVAEDETLASLGAKVAAATMEMIHHVVPGASASSAARGYPAVLNYITADLGPFGGMAGRVDWIHSGHGDPAHKVRLQVHDFDRAGEPTLDFDLDVEVFDEPARRWAVRHFLRLFDALVADPDVPLSSVPLVTWEEESAWAPRGEPHAAPASVLPGIRRAAADAPGEVAVLDAGRSITRGRLRAGVEAVARRLAAAGVRPGDTVGICMGRSAELVAAILGTLEVGAAFVPMDPGHPDDRLRQIAADAGVRLVLTAPGLAGRVSGWGAVGPVEVDGSMLDGPVAGESAAQPVPIPADRLAYILYTSGSTGAPKGVEVTHGALADYAGWACGAYVDEEGLRFPLFTSPAFDFTLTSVFVPLLSGGVIVVYPEEMGSSGLLVRRVFEDDAVDVVKVTPSHLALIRDLDLARSRIRRLVVGGEDLPAAAAERVRRAFGGRVEIFNEYGPTEATIACMIHRYDPDSDRGSSVPIGGPAGNMRVHVVDTHGHPLPRGAAGEICIRGPRLARGYRHRPDLTDAAFVDVPASPGERMYRSGDRGRWTAAGPMEFLGRLDQQVKVRGVRLELAEVEAALTRHTAVREAAARVVRGGAGSGEHCMVCGLEGAHPAAHLDEAGVCAPCRRFRRDRHLVDAYFGDMAQLDQLLAEARRAATGPNDTLMLYSGGKDSTYALCRIVEMGARPLVFLLDNGFISEQAKANVRRVVDQLGLELVVGETPAMPGIFADSLRRFSNVCNGCFKTIYTLAVKLAVERGIPAIVTGLSRGQLFETRLAELYRRGVQDPAEVDRVILEARKAYHRMDDAVSRALDTSMFDDGALDRIRFIDFFRYCDASLEELLAYVREHTPWIRPDDTGRSTNCLINQAGIFVHRTERGFHNYSLPYSWDVRLGHKDREAMLKELDDEIDPAAVRRMLDAVGYRERPAAPPEAKLMAYYTADRELAAAELRDFLATTLPGEAIPSGFVRLERMPLTPNGKVDRDALPAPQDERPVLASAFVAPRTAVEETLVAIWCDVLGLQGVGVHDDFFELGGDSMDCIQIVSAAVQSGLALTPRDVFSHPTVAALADIATTTAGGRASDGPAPATLDADELAELRQELGG